MSIRKGGAFIANVMRRFLAEIDHRVQERHVFGRLGNKSTMDEMV
jgi:hypothetical protein